jgi:Fic family protein
MFDAGPKGFEGGMTAKKYMSITGTSKATATRDLQVLTDLRIFISSGAGRSNHYTLNLEP